MAFSAVVVANPSAEVVAWFEYVEGDKTVAFVVGILLVVVARVATVPTYVVTTWLVPASIHLSAQLGDGE